MAKAKNNGWGAAPLGESVFMLIAGGEIDQVCETNAIAQREKRDLEKLGCVVKVRIFTGTTKAQALERAQAYEDKIRG